MTNAALLLLSSLAQAAAGEPAAPPQRPAFGWVLDEARQPVLGARVEVLAEPNAPKPLLSVVSGEFGRFQIPALAPGSYALRFQAAGYTALVEPRVQIPAGTEPFDLGRFRLERKVTLEGRVVVTHGEPLAGAQVWLRSRGGSKEARLRATSDGAGELRIPDLDRGVPVSLAVCRQGFQAVAMTVPDPAALVQVILTPGSRIEGRIVNQERQPIAGARVATDPWPADPPCGERLGTAKTGDNGRFLFDSLREESYDLYASAEGYIGAELEHVAPSSGDSPTVVEMVLKRGALLLGTVFTDTGEPVAGATLQALGDHAQPKAQSDPQGRFLLQGVEPMLQIVRVSHPDFRPSETTVRITEGENSHDFVLTRIARLSVSGRVVGPDDTPIAGARVELDGKAIATTDALGKFAFVKGGGTYELTAWKAGFAPGITRPPVVVADRPVSGVEIRLGKSAAVSGRLLGLPAGTRARVTAASASFTVQGSVGRDGAYRIADLGAGEWEVTATDGRRTAVGRVKLGRDESEKTLDLSFAPLFEVSGWVLAPSGDPVAGADVRFAAPPETGGSGASAKSGPDGSFRVELEPGRYRAGCRRPGYSPGTLRDPVVVAAGPVTKLVLNLGSGLAIRVTFRGLAKHERVHEVWAEGEHRGRANGSEGFDGETWIAHLSPGDYTVSARLADRVVSRPVWLDAAQGEAHVELEFVLGNEMLQGRLAQPLEEPAVAELFAGQTLIARMRIPGSGFFMIHRLVAGKYRLRVKSERGEEVFVEQNVTVPYRGVLTLDRKPRP